MSSDASEMPIHLFAPEYRVEESLREIRDCLETGWTGTGRKTIEFEEAWKAYAGFSHAHFLNSATAGLHLSLRILKALWKWNEGDEVITTPLTFVSTNHAILYERLTPVFTDVDEFLCLDPDSIDERRTKKTRAVIFVGLGGNSGRLAQVAEYCRDHGLRLILDGAHMAGTRIDGRHAGLETDASVFSFHSVKNLPTADGGMVCFREEEADRLARKLSWLGISRDTYSRTVSGKSGYRWRYDVEEVGFKYHGNSIMAALGLVALRYLDRDNAYRRQLSSWYEELLQDAPGVTTIRVPPGTESSRHLFQVLVEDRDGLVSDLNRRNIFPGVHYQVNTSYPMYRTSLGSCRLAESVSHRIISLPLHLRMTRRDVERVSAAVRRHAEHVSTQTVRKGRRA